jgi:spermidine/putrescine transport system permease protein
MYSVEWRGFTLQWYIKLWHSIEVWKSVLDSWYVACIAAGLSLMMGLLAVVYGVQTGLKRYFVLFYASVAIPEVVLAVGLLSLFIFLAMPLGYTTLIIAHALIGLGYVIPIIQTRFSEIDKRLIEASSDLGATYGQTLYNIIVPLLVPALLSAAILVFIISWDDFILSFFCSGSSVQTVPLYIFSMIRSGTTPLVNALSTLLLVLTSLLVLIFTYLNRGWRIKR